MAVVGPSGSGKSSLVSLLLRLYDTDAGESKILLLLISYYRLAVKTQTVTN